MASIGGLTSLTNYSSLFSNRSSSSTSSIYDLLTDYNYVQNGAYCKVLNATYGKTVNESRDSRVAAEKANQEVVNELTTIKGDAGSLKTDAMALTKGENGLYEQITLSDGTKGYDMEAISAAAKGFVDSYNALLKDAVDSEELSVLRPTASLTNMTKENSELLGKVGITINKDNTLSIDQSKFEKASISDITSLFKGTGSYAGGVASKAAMVQYNAAYQASVANSYDSAGGGYSLSNKIGSIMDGTI